MTTALQQPVARTADARPPQVRSRVPADHPRPAARAEQWRYLPLDRIAGLLDESRPSVPASIHTADGEPALPRISAEQRDLRSLVQPSDWVAARAYAGSTGATVLTVPAETVHATPLAVSVDIQPRASHPPPDQTATAPDQPSAAPSSTPITLDHLIIAVGPHSDAHIELTIAGVGAAALLVELQVADGARLRLVTDCALARESVLMLDQQVTLQRDATYIGLTCQRGGDVVRATSRVDYRGPGSRAELLGLNVTGPGQHHESRPLIHHAVPHCSSDVAYKAVVHGADSHAVWIGDVIVEASATDIDTYELNRTILLDAGARADSVPNLELKTGDVLRAGHASVTGQLDPEQVFYLQARGLTATAATHLIVRGFFADLLARAGDDRVAEQLLSALDHALGEDHA
ncbi:MAG: SufD family Fe-S cluster assembly protein [Actinomycetales bacterium]|nr:SufD family Fe-S cluster assembly protein [Actinomycetales bacterium]